MNNTVAARIFFYFLLFIALLVTAIQFFKYFNSPPFSPDSWSYFEISKTLFTNFLHINTIRQFEYHSYYSISFPPLYPLIVALVGHIIPNIGVYAGYVSNFCICLVTCVVCIQLGKKLFISHISGIGLYLLLLLNPFYLEQVVAAQSLPLSILILLLCLLVFLQTRLSQLYIFLIAITAGLAVLTRFDNLLVGIALGLAVPFLVPKNKYRSLCTYYVTFFIVLSPWMLYSYTHFSKLFISDNVRTIILASDSYITDYFPNIHSQSTIFNHPLLWLKYWPTRLAVSLQALSVAIYQYSAILTLLAYLLLTYLFVQVKNLSTLKDIHMRKVIALTSCVSLQIVTVCLTGFTDLRYFILIIFLLELSILLVGYTWVKQLRGSQIKTQQYLIPVMIFLVIGMPSLVELVQWRELRRDNLVFDSESLASQSYRPILKLLRPGAVLLIQSGRIDPFKFGAITGVKTIVQPSNLNRCSLVSLIQKYKITDIYITNEMWLPIIDRYFKHTIHEPNMISIHSVLKRNYEADCQK